MILKKVDSHNLIHYINVMWFNLDINTISPYILDTNIYHSFQKYLCK